MIMMQSPESDQPQVTAEDSLSLNKSNVDKVAKFAGKIVYNPDGSTYIIEDADLGDGELPKQEGCIVEDDSSGLDTGLERKSYPQIANAFVVSRSSAYYNALYGQAFVKLMQDRNVPETPVVHSYRVYSARNNSSTTKPSQDQGEMAASLPSVVPVKPILMCFICKLSFGCSKSFASHCGDLHQVSLTEEEQAMLHDTSKNNSAIIQYVGTDQEVTLSFLEPTVSKSTNPVTSLASSMTLANLIQSGSKSSPPMSPGAIANFLSVAAAFQQAKGGLPVHTSTGSDGEDSLMQPPSVASRLEDGPDGAEARSPPNFTRYSSPSPSSTSSFSQLPLTSRTR